MADAFLPWSKLDTRYVLALRDERIADDRAASTLEAYAEWLALDASGRLPDMGIATLAKSWRWSRGKVRRHLAVWTDGQGTDTDIPSTRTPKVLSSTRDCTTDGQWTDTKRTGNGCTANSEYSIAYYQL